MNQVVMQYHSFCLVAFLFIETSGLNPSPELNIRTLLGSMSMTILWLKIMRFFVFLTTILGRPDG
jgi:hypothetical protein